MSKKFRGSMVALVTPFSADKEVDWDALGGLVDFQVRGGTHGLVICGTTGEAATMTPEECKKVLAFVVERVQGKIPVIAGTGSNNTKTAVAASLAAKEVGVDGLLVVTPPYNKPTQEGLLHYYNTILSEVKLPTILYNVPGRTCSNLLPETVEKLAENELVVGIKDATADLYVGAQIKERCGDRITLLSGDDFTALPLLSIGGEGWISVTANVAPVEMAAMFDAWEEGDLAKARELHYKMMPLHRAMFWQSNPIPVKTALALMGHIQPFLRSPLMEMKGQKVEELSVLLREKGLIGVGA